MLKYPTLYMFRVHVEAYTTVPSELNIFHRCSQKPCVFHAHLDFILVRAPFDVSLLKKPVRLSSNAHVEKQGTLGYAKTLVMGF